MSGISNGPDRADRAYRNSVFLFLLGTAMLSLVIYAALGQPDVPYNFASLFLHGSSILDIALFACALLWIGMGATFAARLAIDGRAGFALLPLWVVAAALVSYVLIVNSVTDESVGDIVGVPVFFREVTRKHEWGWFGAQIVSLIGDRSTIDAIETVVRYVALYGAVSLPIVAAIGVFLIWERPRKTRSSKVRSGAAFFVYAALGTYVCKLVVIDYAATNNITELIAPSAWSMGSGLWPLFALILFAASNAVFASRIPGGGWRPLAHAAMFTPVALIFGWYLLNSGLIQHLYKYELTFSGVDFLLGPDRKKLLPQHLLFMRWAFVYVAVVLGLGFGIAIGRFARPGQTVRRSR